MTEGNERFHMEYIRDNRLKRSRAEMARRLGITVSRVDYYRKKLGVTRKVWGSEHDQFVVDHPELDSWEIADALGFTYNTVIEHKRMMLDEIKKVKDFDYHMRLWIPTPNTVNQWRTR